MQDYGKYAEIAESWIIADDAAADWALKKIAEERAERQRLIDLADTEIAILESKKSDVEKRYENNTRFLLEELQRYFGTVTQRQTKTQSTYRLLSGTLKYKHGGAVMKPGADLLQFLKDSGREEFIQTEEKPKWSELKKRLAIEGDVVVDTATGEVVEGVTIEDKPGEFIVEV